MIDLLTSMQTEAWAMCPRALEAFASAVASRARGAPGADAPAQPANVSADGVAEIDVRGVLLRGKRDPWLAAFGVAHTGYDDLRQQIEQAAADPAVKSIALAVDSPGGMASGIARVIDSLRAARAAKPVTARVESMAASAAYWIASQAQTIEADRDSVVGSIGAYSVVADFSRAAEDAGIKVHVLRTGPHKGTGAFGAPVSADQLAPLQAIVDDVGAAFAADIAAGRRMTPARVQEAATGAAWTAPRALALGLIDSVGRAAPGPKKETRMSQETAAAPPAKKAATIADLKAEFGQRPQFVLEQLEIGASIEEARTAHLKVERDELVAENAKLKAAASAPAKPAPAPSKAVPSGPAADVSDEPTDFVAAAREYAAAHKTTMRKAMSAIAARDPDGHREYVAALPRVRRAKK
jgi:signal peptide peptidase SppA